MVYIHIHNIVLCRLLIAVLQFSGMTLQAWTLPRQPSRRLLCGLWCDRKPIQFVPTRSVHPLPTLLCFACLFCFHCWQWSVYRSPWAPQRNSPFRASRNWEDTHWWVSMSKHYEGSHQTESTKPPHMEEPFYESVLVVFVESLYNWAYHESSWGEVNSNLRWIGFQSFFVAACVLTQKISSSCLSWWFPFLYLEALRANGPIDWENQF